MVHHLISPIFSAVMIDRDCIGDHPSPAGVSGSESGCYLQQSKKDARREAVFQRECSLSLLWLTPFFSLLCSLLALVHCCTWLQSINAQWQWSSIYGHSILCASCTGLRTRYPEVWPGLVSARCLHFVPYFEISLDAGYTRVLSTPREGGA